MGGGVGLSVLGKFRVTSEKSLFAMPETAIGIFPDVGGSAWLPHLNSGVGEYIGLSGARLGAADLLHTGIATHFVPSSRLNQLEEEIKKITDVSPTTIETLINHFSETPTDTGNIPSKYDTHTFFLVFSLDFLLS